MKEEDFKLLRDIIYEIIEDDALKILISRVVNDHNEDKRYDIDERLRNMKREFRHIWLHLHPLGNPKVEIPIIPTLTVEMSYEGQSIYHCYSQ